MTEIATNCNPLDELSTTTGAQEQKPALIPYALDMLLPAADAYADKIEHCRTYNIPIGPVTGWGSATR